MGTTSKGAEMPIQTALALPHCATLAVVAHRWPDLAIPIIVGTVAFAVVDRLIRSDQTRDPADVSER
jgi:hypothetical protein